VSQLSYQISSQLLPTDFRERMIIDTLEQYLRGDDMKKSPLTEWGHRVVERGDWWYGCEGKTGDELEDAIQRRQREVIELYHSLEDKGYDGSPISIYVDREIGKVNTYDGFHRLSIMKFLGLEAMMNCVISYNHPTDPNQRGDFHLAGTLAEINSGNNLYQPLDDLRVEGWHVWRHDSQDRLSFLLDDTLVSGTVCDVGCSTGFFSRGLTRAGFKVTGLEHSQKRIAVARYVATIKNIEMDFIKGCWQHELRGRKFDNIISLSVFHHDILAHGLKQLQEDLEVLRGSCKRLVVEMPLASAGVKWLSEDKKGLWSLTFDELVCLLEEATDMKFLKMGVGLLEDRPLIVLEAPR